MTSSYGLWWIMLDILFPTLQPNDRKIGFMIRVYPYIINNALEISFLNVIILKSHVFQDFSIEKSGVLKKLSVGNTDCKAELSKSEKIFNNDYRKDRGIPLHA